MNWLVFAITSILTLLVSALSVRWAFGLGRRRGHNDALDAMDVTFRESFDADRRYSERVQFVLFRLRWQMRLEGQQVNTRTILLSPDFADAVSSTPSPKPEDP